MGRCPKCHQDTLYWLGIDYLDRVVSYNPIAYKRHRDWINRFDTDLVRRHSKNAASMVQGSVYDSRSGHYIFRTNIEVS